MKKIIFFAILLFVLIFSKNVFAVTTTIDNFPSTISSDPFTVNITISGASAGTNYLRIDLYKISTANYFGETFNGSSWCNTGDYVQYYPITIQSGNNWTGQVQGRLGNPTSTQYDGPGQYKIKVRRYTSSGSYSTTEANNSALDIIISVPTSTPTPEITLAETVIPTPTETPIITAEITERINPSPTEFTSTPTPYYLTPTPFSYNNIYISEVMVNPAAGEKEWLEIYNNNDFPVSLNNWYIDDLENAGSSPRIFSLEISAKSYGVIDLSSSMFNNDGDSVRLLDFKRNLKDDFEYQNTETGKTLGRTSFDSDDFCLQESSKNFTNNSCLNPAPTAISSVKTEQINLSPTKNVVQTKIPIYTGRINLTPTMQVNSYTQNSSPHNVIFPTVLGISTKTKNNSSLINLLTILSVLYSLLTIISILFRMNLLYGKNKNFYSSSLCSS